MTISSRRPFAAAAVLALMLTQLLAAHAGVFAGALAAGFTAHGHGHEVSVLGAAGHVKVVLHHGDRGDPLGTLGQELGAHAGDHVVHFATSDPAREGKARVPAPVHALPLVTPMAPPEGKSRAIQTAVIARGDSASLLRTVVLRV